MKRVDKSILPLFRDNFFLSYLTNNIMEGYLYYFLFYY